MKHENPPNINTEGSEKMEDLIEIDPYLKNLRIQEQEQKDIEDREIDGLISKALNKEDDTEKQEKISKLQSEIDAEITFNQSPTKEEIREAQANKSPGDEKAFFPVNNSPINKKGLKRLFAAAFAGLLSLGAKASGETKTPENLNKKSNTENVSTSKSVESESSKKGYEQTNIEEKVGHITIEGNVFIPQKDTTKEVYVYYFSDDGKSKNSLEEILNIMLKKGLRPADGKMLEEIYQQNKNDQDFDKKTKWIMAPVPSSDADDTRSAERYLVTKNGKSKYELPEHSVFPTKGPVGLGRFEINQGFSTQEYGLMFFKETDKENTANYLDFVKK